MTTEFLLDANALVALVVAEHVHHDLVASWAADVGGVALCPVVEGALVRFLVRTGESSSTAVGILSAMYATPGCVFWPDDVSYTAVDIGHVVGHQQVTDAYLVALAVSRGCRLATLDEGLGEVLPLGTEVIR